MKGVKSACVIRARGRIVREFGDFSGVERCYAGGTLAGVFGYLLEDLRGKRKNNE